MVIHLLDFLLPKKVTEQDLIDQAAEAIVEAIAAPSKLSSVRRADAFNEYRQYKEDTGDTLTFSEFLESTR